MKQIRVVVRSFEISHITNQCACSTPGAIIFPPFYAMCGREFFQKRRKKTLRFQKYPDMSHNNTVISHKCHGDCLNAIGLSS